MPNGRRLRGLHGEQVIAAFVRAGGEQRSSRSSHCNIKMPNGQIITIPRHGEVKVGLLRAAVRRAGLTVEQFEVLL